MIYGAGLADFLRDANNKVGGYLWAILLAAFILLLVILFLVIGSKNRRIKKLKKELKSTRTQLEMARSLNEEMTAAAQERSKKKSEQTAESAAKKQDEQQAEQVEFDEEADAPAKNKTSAADEDDETERMAQSISYYNRPTEISQKGGNVKFTVLYDRAKDSWVIKRNGTDRAVRRVDTKEEALFIARQLCKKYDAKLVVHKKDGKFQKQ